MKEEHLAGLSCGQLTFKYLSYDVDLLVETGNQVCLKRSAEQSKTDKLSLHICEISRGRIFLNSNPTSFQVLSVVEVLVEKYPCLKEQGSFKGSYGWQQRMT